MRKVREGLAPLSASLGNAADYSGNAIFCSVLN